MDVLSRPVALGCRRFTFWHEGLTFLAYLQCKKNKNCVHHFQMSWTALPGGVEVGVRWGWGSWRSDEMCRLMASQVSRFRVSCWNVDLLVSVRLPLLSLFSKQNELWCNQVALFARADVPTFLNVHPTPLFSGIQFCLPSNCSFDRTPQQTPGKPATWESFTDRQCETFCFNLSSLWNPPIKHLALVEPGCSPSSCVWDYSQFRTGGIFAVLIAKGSYRPLLFCIQTGGVF